MQRCGSPAEARPGDGQALSPGGFALFRPIVAPLANVHSKPMSTYTARFPPIAH